MYHHGTLDTRPTLRRLTLADREDKDYISRQARLSIKANGVYAVTGTEPFDDHPSSPSSSSFAHNLHHGSHMETSGSHLSSAPQLQWRFEYVVLPNEDAADMATPAQMARVVHPYITHQVSYTNL